METVDIKAREIAKSAHKRLDEQHERVDTLYQNHSELAINFAKHKTLMNSEVVTPLKVMEKQQKRVMKYVQSLVTEKVVEEMVEEKEVQSEKKKKELTAHRLNKLRMVILCIGTPVALFGAWEILGRIIKYLGGN